MRQNVRQIKNLPCYNWYQAVIAISRHRRKNVWKQYSKVCNCHIVFIPKYHQKLMYGRCWESLMRIMKWLLENLEVEIVEGAMCIDHVHISIGIQLKYSVAYVMGYLRVKSALKFFDENPEMRCQTVKDRTLWARGYYVNTVGLNEEVIRNYIREQEESDQFVTGK